MKQVLDGAIAEVLGRETGGRVAGLRAVVLSIAPDGLIAWCWSRDGKPDIALGFAALDRAANVCLEGLGASTGGRSLLLTARDAWVASWPLSEAEPEPEAEPGPDASNHLVITTVFEGELQSGMVMVYGTRVRHHLREALAAAQSDEIQRLRAALVTRLLTAPEPLAELSAIAEAADVPPHALSGLAQLDPERRERVRARLHDAPPRGFTGF